MGCSSSRNWGSPIAWRARRTSRASASCWRAARCAGRVELGARVDRIERVDRIGAPYRLSVDGRSGRAELGADVVVLSTPSWAAAAIARPLDAALADLLAGIPYSPVAVTALGF